MAVFSDHLSSLNGVSPLNFIATSFVSMLLTYFIEAVYVACQNPHSLQTKNLHIPFEPSVMVTFTIQ